MNLTEIVDRIADRSSIKGRDRELAWILIQEVLDGVIATLGRGEEVKVRGLGRFYWAKAKARVITLDGEKYKVPACLRLRFDPADKLRRRDMADEDEGGITKLGVVLDDDKVKQSGVDTSVPSVRECPLCHQKLDEAGVCPDHGTEPLERKAY